MKLINYILNLFRRKKTAILFELQPIETDNPSSNVIVIDGKQFLKNKI